MKAMEEIVEFLGEFCRDKVACESKSTDLVGSLRNPARSGFTFNPEMKLPSTFAWTGCFVYMKLPENAHKQDCFGCGNKVMDTLEKFNEDEVWRHLGKSSRAQEYADDLQNEDSVESSEVDVKPVYVKDDFFDSLSYDSLGGGSRNGRTRFSEQMTRDTEEVREMKALLEAVLGQLTTSNGILGMSPTDGVICELAKRVEEESTTTTVTAAATPKINLQKEALSAEKVFDEILMRDEEVKVDKHMCGSLTEDYKSMEATHGLNEIDDSIEELPMPHVVETLVANVSDNSLPKDIATSPLIAYVFGICVNNALIDMYAQGDPLDDVCGVFKVIYDGWVKTLQFLYEIEPEFVRMLSVAYSSHVNAIFKVPLESYMMDFVLFEKEDGGTFDNKDGMYYLIPILGGFVKEPPTHIVHIAVEMAPIAKVGCICDVTTPSHVVQDINHNVNIILSKHDCLILSHVKELHYQRSSFWGAIEIKNWFAKVESNSAYCQEPQNEIVWKDFIYGCNNDTDRFEFFCYIALEFLHQSGLQPDIIHCHDCTVALVAWLFKDHYMHYGLREIRIVFTIHSIELGVHFIAEDHYAYMRTLGCQCFHEAISNSYAKWDQVETGND
ncbi:hypothetical protein V6N12_062632 [Hibiscus sabdariffa]|uniref:starch synthase n=1 Tax=Hibiscus sabdariffa TaxID=183260 RepID=A0ABR2F9E5_9ROSI